ncbi:MAG: DNA repair protein RecO [bacterium]
MPTYKTEGIILRKNNIFEADQIITFYTRHQGKLRAIAKGIRKAKSRRSGHLELFMLTDLIIANGKNLDVITSAENIEAYKHLRNDLEIYSQLGSVLEMVDLMTPEGHNDTRIFTLLKNTLEWLNENAQSKNRHIILRAFEIKLLTITGHAPVADKCVRCGRALKPQRNGFSDLLGGVVCSGCASKRDEAVAISDGAIKLLRLITKNELATVAKISPEDQAWQNLEDILSDFIKAILDRHLPSKDFVRHIKALEKSA